MYLDRSCHLSQSQWWQKTSLGICLHKGPLDPPMSRTTTPPLFSNYSPMASQNPPHFQQVKLGWMICCYFVTSSSHPIWMRFNKSMQTAVRRTLGKGNPPAQKSPNPRIKCLWSSTFVGMLGTGKSALAGSKEERNSKDSWEREIVFQSNVPCLWRQSYALLSSAYLH